jgi:cell division protein FtsB
MVKKIIRKKSNKLFGFFYRYWISGVLLIVLATLIKQNFISNHFPFDTYQKQAILEKSLIDNQQLKRKNQQLQLELNAKSDEKLEILESMARQKFGLIQAGEKYYQISISNQN